MEQSILVDIQTTYVFTKISDYGKTWEFYVLYLNQFRRNYCWTRLWRSRFMQLLGYSVIHFVVRTKSPLDTCFSSFLSATYRRPSTSDHPFQCNFPRGRLFSEFNLFLVLEKTTRLFFQAAIQILGLENESSIWWFQASAALCMRSSLFWDVMKRRFVVSYQSFVDCLTLEDGTDRLSRNFGN